MNRDRLPPSPLSVATSVVMRALVPLVGMTLLVAGLLGVMSFAVLPLVELLRTHDWVPVPATVESVRLQPPRSPIHPPLDSLEISYRYTLDGSAHQGVRFDPHSGLYSELAGGAVAAALQSAPTITVWVNPAAPDQAIVLRTLRWPVLLLALPAAAMLAIGVALVYRGMLAWTGGRAGGFDDGDD